jgi:putative transcriptional regulator
MINVKLDEILQDREKSLYWLQQQTGVAYTTLWKLRTGKANSISFSILGAICAHLECSPGELLVVGEAKATRQKRRH